MVCCLMINAAILCSRLGHICGLWQTVHFVTALASSIDKKYLGDLQAAQYSRHGVGGLR